VSTAADHLLIDVARETAVEVARLARERELAWVNERDHLQPSYTRAARRVVSSLPTDLIVSTSLGFKSPLWPRLGRVDLAFVSGEGTPIAVELKSGAGRDALAACAWDAVKLAFMLRHQQVSAAYLVAATPASDWALGLRGTEFFGASSVDTQALREPYLDWWRSWERDGYPAGRQLPATFETRPITRVPFQVGTTEWVVAVAAVQTGGSEWLEWQPTLKDGLI
jgi:hypothetical protein